MHSRMFRTSTEKVKESYRFDHCRYFNPIRPLLDELREKQIELSNISMSSEPESIDFKKHAAVTKLLTSIDEKINAFNIAPPYSEQVDEIENALMLTKNLLEQMEETLKNDGEILFTPRNNRRLNVNRVVHFGAITGALAFAISGSFTLLGTFVALWGTGLTSQIARYKTKLNDLTPRSACIIIDLTTKLMETAILLSELANYASSPSIKRGVIT